MKTYRDYKALTIDSFSKDLDASLEIRETYDYSNF